MRNLLLGFVACAPLMAIAPAQGETLKEALEIAYQTNPTIRAERARLRATQESKAQAWANALPQVSAQSDYSRTDTSQTAVVRCRAEGPTTVDRKLDTFNAGVNAQQPIFTGFRNFNAIKQADARIRAGGAQLIATEQRVLSDVASAYFNVQRSMAVYELRKKNVDVLTRQNEMATVRFEVGEITRTDVAQADARLALSRAQLSNAQGELSIARSAYAQLVGQSPGDLESVNELPILPDSYDVAVALAREYAPQIIASREQAEIARRDISIAKGALLPSVSLTAGYQYADEPSFFIDESESFAFGARASDAVICGRRQLFAHSPGKGATRSGAFTNGGG